MKYYEIKVKTRYPEKKMIASSAEGNLIPNAEEYFWKMNEGNEIINPPIFDYFYLKSFDIEKYWEWQLNDVHDFIGQGSQIPGWLISGKLKNIFENYKVAEPHYYYFSKLLYEGEKFNYFIFQFSGKCLRLPLTMYVDFTKSLFYDPNNKINIGVSDEKKLLELQKKILIESGYDLINIPIKKIVLNYSLDFISMQNFLGVKLVSERLKQAIEDNGITGFEFSELDYEVVVEK